MPTGMNTGVSTMPCGVINFPCRAPVGSVFATSNEKVTQKVYQEKTEAIVVPNRVKNTYTLATIPIDLDIGTFFGSMK